MALVNGLGSLFATVCIGLTVLTLGCQKPAPPKKFNEDPADLRRREIQGLRKLEQEAIQDARRDGKSEQEINELKAKFQAEIDRLEAEGKAGIGEPGKQDPGPDAPTPDAKDAPPKDGADKTSPKDGA